MAATGHTHILPRPTLHPTRRREQQGRPRQRRRLRRQCKAAVVASRLVRRVHACRGTDAHSSPQKHREARLSARPSRRLSLPRVGRPAGRSQGLAKSRVGIVLVTQALLRRLQGEGIADKELSALLERDQLVPIVHDVRSSPDVSPSLGSRSGLSTAEAPMAEVAAKLAELVAL